MKETKTTLQKIVEQKADQIRIAIEQAIDDGAKIERAFSPTCATIDGMFMQKEKSGRLAIVLYFRSEKIAKEFEPSKDYLEKLKEEKRSELEQIEKQLKEIENQIKEREAQQ